MRYPNRRELSRAGFVVGCMVLAGFLAIVALPLMPGAARSFFEDAQEVVSASPDTSVSTSSAETSALAAPPVPEPTRRPVRSAQIQGIKPDRPENTALIVELGTIGAGEAQVNLGNKDPGGDLRCELSLLLDGAPIARKTVLIGRASATTETLPYPIGTAIDLLTVDYNCQAG